LLANVLLQIGHVRFAGFFFNPETTLHFEMIFFRLLLLLVVAMIRQMLNG
jgi:hypothetical protein